MSQHYSKYALNSYMHTLYFQEHLPGGYPTSLVLQHSRAFRRLPSNLKALAEASKRWSILQGYELEGIENWYDLQGYELNPDTGIRLTDAEIDAQWSPNLAADTLIVQDVPRPLNGFPDPAKWKPKVVKAEVTGPSKQQVLDDVAAQGIEATEALYGIVFDIKEPPEPDTMTFDEEMQSFSKRTAEVLNSPYFANRPDELKMVQHALKSASIYSDLWGNAEQVYQRVEEYEAVRKSYGEGS